MSQDLSAASRGSLDLAALIAAGRQSYSFEFFPPKTPQGEAVLWQAISELEPLSPTFVSVTYGAGGSTQERTVAVTARIAAETSLPAVAHLTCVGATESQLRAVIERYRQAGVRTVLALRGDPAGGPGALWQPTPGGYTHAVELVALLRSMGDFGIGVAAFPEGHPESTDLVSDARVLAAKQEAGADFAVTQFFFHPDDYFRLVDRAARHGATLPVIPGIMPVTSVSQIKRFAVLSGADFPPHLATRFDAVADDPRAVRDLGVEVATDMCRRLLDGGAPGLHFYTLNRSTATREIYANLGLVARR
jgi:methylenetetrahydrofolate reductase (NADPH)